MGMEGPHKMKGERRPTGVFIDKKQYAKFINDRIQGKITNIPTYIEALAAGYGLHAVHDADTFYILEDMQFIEIPLPIFRENFRPFITRTNTEIELLIHFEFDNKTHYFKRIIHTSPAAGYLLDHEVRFMFFGYRYDFIQLYYAHMREI